MSALSASSSEPTTRALLPIPPVLKVTSKAIYIGDPKQLVELLVSKVATAILEITRTKGNQPLYKLKLRCKTLFPGNIEVYFLLDFPNQTLFEGTNYKGDPEIHTRMDRESEVWPVVDQARALQYRANLDIALGFWSVKMEEEVKKVYPDKTPVQVDRYCREGLLEMKVNSFVKDFALDRFVSVCNAKSATPCFHVSYGWITGTEDPRSNEQAWGFKFELSPYPQYPVAVRTRKPAIPAAERQEALLKKRKVEEEEVAEENLC